MSRRAESAPRMGPVSVFVLVMTVCLAVLAVLCFTTSRAELAVARRQAATVEATYANEAEGQAFVAELEGALVGTEGREQQLAAVDGVVRAWQGELPSGAQVRSSREGTQVSAEFEQPSGRRLDVRLEVADGTVRIASWTAHTAIPEDTGEQVWKGPGA